MESPTVFVLLDRIRPNPWQVRQKIDPEHTKELAADIAARGLLQAPAGRIVDEDGKPMSLPPGFRTRASMTMWLYEYNRYVQLAFGHSRVDAFRLLNEELGEAYAEIPVQVGEFSDQALALAAWSENYQRKDLSSIEEALAIRRRMEDFGWTQEQVAQELGLARATVANKVRLLQLPQEVRNRVDAGEVPERAALALKTFYDLPTKVQGILKRDWSIRNILQDPGDYSSDQIRDGIDRAIQFTVKDLKEKAAFPLEEPIEGEDIVQLTCAGCPDSIKRKGKHGCINHRCFEAKTKQHWAGILERASQELGIPTRAEGEDTDDFMVRDPIAVQAVALALEHGCENLRLAVSSYTVGDWKVGPEGHPHIYYVCTKKSRSCTCRQEADAERREAEKERRQELCQVRDRVIDRVAKSILNAEAIGLRAILAHFFRYYQDQRDKALARKKPEQIAQAIARELLDGVNVSAAGDAQAYERLSCQWLESRGFSTTDKDPLQEIADKIERVRGFLAQQDDEIVRVEALQGNLHHLARLRQRLELLDGQVDTEWREQLLAKIDEVKSEIEACLA